jgi:hypothetical protein
MTVGGDVIPFTGSSKRKRAFEFPGGVPDRDLPANTVKMWRHPLFKPPPITSQEPIPRAYSPAGRLLPPLGIDRIRLRRHRVTRAWWAIANKLEAATALTAALDRAGGATEGPDAVEVEATLTSWRAVAAEAIRLEMDDARHLREKVALVAAVTSIPFHHGWLYDKPESDAELALALVDSLCFHARYALERPPPRRSAGRRISGKSPRGRGAPTSPGSARR